MADPMFEHPRLPAIYDALDPGPAFVGYVVFRLFESYARRGGLQDAY